MERKYYLAYGSNLNINQMLHRCPDAERIGSSVIENYRLTFRGNSRSGVANIEPCDGESVPVGIWEISPSDEIALNRYEGFPWLYEKQMFTVSMRGRTIEAMAYIMTPGHEIAVPSRYYLATIMQGYSDFGFDIAPLKKAVVSIRKEKRA